VLRNVDLIKVMTHHSDKHYMMRSIVSIILLLLLGCATGESAAERSARMDKLRAEVYQEDKAFEAKQNEQREAKANTAPGMTVDQVKAVWGESDQIEYIKGFMVFNYGNDGHPVNMKFKDGKLVELAFDRDAAQRIQEQKTAQENADEQRRAEQLRIEAAKKAAFIGSLNQASENTSNAFRRPSSVNENTNNSSGSTASAYWTGKSKMVQTVTYQPGVSCQYSYAGQYFWKTFTGAACPQSVNVE
jgi:hypothetical protein